MSLEVTDHKEEWEEKDEEEEKKNQKSKIEEPIPNG